MPDPWVTVLAAWGRVAARIAEMSEVFDVYDDGGDWLGSAPRDEVHARGLWHVVFQCWIVADRGGVPHLLFQIRSGVEQFPRRLDITAAGHLQAGERPEEGVRELEEELGVQVPFERLVPLGRRTETMRIGTTVNREFCDTYLLRDDRPLTGYVLQAEEVAGLVEIPVADGLRLFGEEVAQITARGVRLVDGALEEHAIDVRADDVIPRRERYYLKVLIMAERLFAGERHLAI